MDKTKEVVPVGKIEHTILLVRGQKIMLDADLARLYGTTTGALNQAIKRRAERFPADFMFQLSAEEKEEVITNCDHLKQLKYSPSLPYAFTEHGALMVASVLNTPRAIAVSVYVVRAFVKLREMIKRDKELSLKLAELERKVASHDQAILMLVREIKKITEYPKPKKLDVGFKRRNKEK